METTAQPGHQTLPDRTSPATADTGFAKGLFFGNILSERVFPYAQTDPDELNLLQMTSQAIRKMALDVDVSRIEREKRVPDDILDVFRQMGLFGLVIPETYGGFGMSNSAYTQIFSEISMVDGSLCTMVGAHQSIGCKALLLFGTQEQKQRFLPRLATGEMIAAFGLTEPEAGSDAQSLKTTATLTPEGDYLINGSKIWITNGGIADFFTVFARTSHPDAPEGKRDAITAFIVTRDMPGFSSGPEEKKLGMCGSSTTSLHFDNVRVPQTNILGEPGKGFRVALAVLNNGRLGLAGACSIGVRKLIQMAREHALTRKQFGKPLAEFGLIQSKFAAMAMDAYVGEACVRTTAHLMDRGMDYAVESAMCKVYNTEALWRSVNECIQIAGGTGYMVESGYEKILRDSRIFMIWEGANEVLRLFIGLSGLQGPGEQLKEIAKTLKQPLRNKVASLGVLSEFGVRWIARRVGTMERLKGVHPRLAAEAEVFERYTARLAEASEVALRKEGKGIVDNQFAVRRLADVATDLYALSCALSRASQAVEAKGENADHDVRIVRTFCRKARRRMAENLRRMHRNDDDSEKRIAQTIYEEGLPQHGLFL